MAKDPFAFLKDLEKKTGQKVQTVALLYENTEFGSQAGKAYERYAKEFGYKVVANISYPNSATDVSSEVSKLIVAKPDVLLHASYITDAILFTKTFKEKGFQPKGIITMAGYIEPAYLPAVKADGNYIFIRSTFATDLAKSKPLVAKVNALYKQKYGHDMSENAARSFMAPFVIADAINRAKSTDPDAILKALNETNIPGNQLIYPWQGIKFDPKTHQNIYAKGTLVQVLGQNYVTVWPFEAASKPFVWPFPAWQGRK
jgi:branched-chain amino acid transport system substrate-binding protein